MRSAVGLVAVHALATVASAFNTSAYSRLLPTASPIVTTTASQCTHINLTSVFDVPRPTGALGTAFSSYARGLTADCSTRGDLDSFACLFPEVSEWCGFTSAVTSAVPSALLPDFSSFAASGSSWWAAQSTKVYSLAEECPDGWYNGGSAPFGCIFLNWTVAFAGACEPGDGIVTTVTTSGVVAATAATSGPGTPGSGPAGSPTQTGAPSHALGRMEGLQLGLLILIGLVGAMVNSA